jgi:hypothetical protein
MYWKFFHVVPASEFSNNGNVYLITYMYVLTFVFDEPHKNIWWDMWVMGCVRNVHVCVNIHLFP